MTVIAPASPRTPAPLSPEEIARVRAPFRRATLLPARAYHDEAVHAWEMDEIFLRDQPRDDHVVALQQQGTRSRSWTAGRYSNQEASVHAFDIMVADRYANDGSGTVRGWRTETAGEGRLSARRVKAGAGTSGDPGGATQ